MPPSRLEFHGFEPDDAECERLNSDLARMGIAGRYYPIGLWDRTAELPFHVNRAAGGSSFLDQNTTLTNRWRIENASAANLARDVFVPERTTMEKVSSVRDWSDNAGVTRIDFCKLNVQGGELLILEGFGELLDGVLGMLLEVAFVESYRDRPLFADVDGFARRHGFAFFDLLAHHYVGRASSRFVARHAPGSEGKLGEQRSSWGQLIEGHALFLRDPIAEDGRARPLSAQECVKLACIADIFGQTEYALEVLDWLKKKQEAATVGPQAQAIDRVIAAANQSLGHTS
jgi:FkbM family methyltransferase